MANTFITPTLVARDAAITLNSRLTIGNLVNRDKEAVFTGSKVGDSVKVTIPPAVTAADEFTGTTLAGDVTEKQIDLTLEKHFYKRIDLTSKQKSLELSDFTRLVTVPAIQGIEEAIDAYLLKQLQVFRKNLTGTVGNRPSTMAHIAAATKSLNDLKVIRSGRVALIDSTAEQSFSQLAQFQSRDYGDPMGLQEGVLGRRYGFNFVTDVNLGAFDRGYITGTILTNGTPAVGATTLNIDGFSASGSVLRAGTVFTLAGDTTRYVIRKDVTVTAGAADITIAPALAAAPGDGAAVTFEAAGYSNVVYHPNAISAAIVAPSPLTVNSSVQSYNGVSVRVSMDSSITSLSDSIVYDVFVGARVVEPDGGALFCG